MKLSKLSLAIVGCASLAAGMAQAAGPTLSDVLSNSGITESGYIAASYVFQNNINANNVFDSNIHSVAGGSSGYSSFKVQQAGLTLAKQPASGFGGLVNVTAGSDADLIKSFPYSASAGSGDGFDLTQAIVQYASDGNTLQGGKFTNIASNEVISAAANSNITRSVEFYTEPGPFAGVRDTYAVTNSFNLIVGLNNGWGLQQDDNKGKTGELGFALKPSDMLAWTGVVYYGPEQVAPGMSGQRTLVNTVITLKPTNAVAFILSADYGEQKKVLSGGGTASWSAVVGYLNFQMNDQWRTSIRAETFHDSDAVVLATDSPSNGNKRVNEATVTLGYAPVPAFELRGEVRDDWADKRVYFASNGHGHKSAFTTAIEGLYKF